MVDPNKRAAEIDEDLKAADAKRRADAETERGFAQQTLDLLTKLSARLDALEAAPKDRADEGNYESDRLNKMKANGQNPGAPRQLDDIDEKADAAALAQAQLRADGVATAFSQRAPAPMTGERPVAYRKRLLHPYLGYSKEFKAIDLETVSSEAVLAGLETRIYADAVAASCRPDVPAGELYERQSIDASGRKISTFFGEPRAWMSQFAPVPGRLVGFNTKSNG